MGRSSNHQQRLPSILTTLIPPSFLVLTTIGSAQSLEPRAYSPSPVGVNFAVVGLSESSGSVLLDPSLPVTNVTARIYGTALAYGHTFAWLGRQALVTTAFPYAWGNLQGQVSQTSTSLRRSGAGDLQARFSVNVLGSPALSPQAFAKEPERFILGTSLTVVAPTGQYDPARLINIGTNRWAFKPELGMSYPWKKFVLELYGGVWFFTDNRSYYPGQATKRQDPLTTVQGHFSYTFKPRLWLAFDSTWYGGGASTVNHVPDNDRQSNSRAGVTLSLPLGRAQSLKTFYSRGVTARSGQEFTSYGMGYQVVWF